MPVTEDNKKEYVDLIVEYRISRRVKEQFEAFMSGFSELIPQELINVFDERELELLIGGMSEIDVYVSFLFSPGFLSLCESISNTFFSLFLVTTGANSPTTEGTK